MEDCKPENPEVEVGDDLIVAAKSIARALGSKKNLTDSERKILADLGTKLSSLMTNRSTLSEIKVEDFGDIENRLISIHDKVMGWEADQTMIWDSSSNEANEYLNTVEETRQLIESLESLCLSKDDEKYELLHKANDVLQTAMTRLEDEFRYMLVQNRQPCAPEHMSFRSCEEDAVDANSLMSFGDDSVEDSFQRDSFSRASVDSVIDLVRPEVIPDLRGIANVMFNCNYERECTQAYTTLRRDALDECLSYLEIQKLSIEDVRKMKWVSLNSKIRRWVWVMKIFVRIYLASDKWLSEQIFEELGPVRLDCFVEASKASILQLLNFAEAMSIGPHQPEKLVRILDMYEVLADVLPDIDDLYFGEAGSSIIMECHDVLVRLGDSVKATVIEFENAIASNPSTSPVTGGGIHPLTRYVMNYMRTLTDYGPTLDLLLKDCDEGDPISLSPDTSPTKEEGNESTDSSGRRSPMARQFLSFASSLESNLDEKSKLYKDASLQHVFLMNNIHYMAQKVKGAELRLVFGDDWIRKHNRKFQQHAMGYQRASWSYILSLLKEEGIQNPGSNSISKSLLKERLRSFYLAFEEIYKVQSAWLIPDSQLREDLQISTSLNVIQAYRTFVGRHSNDISDKLIKYSADDMENYLMDLFEGTPKFLQNSSRSFKVSTGKVQWYLDLAPKAADLSKIGVTSVWFPPPTESVAPQGYMPSDLYNLNSAYGTEEELKHCIAEMHAHDLLALGDVVLNHRCAHKQSPNGVWNIFGGKLAWGPEVIVCDDLNFEGRGNPSSGDIFHAAPNVDHSKDFVRKDIKEWLNWLRSDIGFDGWRLDFVRGFSGTYVKEYIEASSPAFAIGEYWDSLAYENGNLCYNQDAHRQRIVDWINATGGSSSAFDVTTKGILHSVLHNQYWRLIDPQGKPTGVMGWWPSRAVTFLENHDTGSTQGHWPFPRDKLTQGYAYILTHPGTPTIFYDHLYDFGLHEIISELIEARRRAGIHCRSAVKIYHANNEGYVAQIGDTLVMKLGHFDWNPSKENLHR